MAGPETEQSSSPMVKAGLVVLVLLLAVVVFLFLFFFVIIPVGLSRMEVEFGAHGVRAEDPSEYVWHAPPQWLPDGKQIIFSIGGRIYAAESDGSAVRLIQGDDGGDDLNHAPRLSPDGTEIIYHRYRQDGFLRDPRHWEVAISSIDGSDERTLTGFNEKDAWNSLSGLSWSDGGRRITFRWTEDWSYYSMSADGSDVARLDVEPVPMPWGLSGIEKLDVEPVPIPWGLSADGTQKAWVEYERHHAEITVYATRLFTSDKGGARQRELFWLPKGFRQRELFWFSPYFRQEIEPPQWSPDDSLILAGPFVVDADGSHLMVLPRPDGTGPIRPDPMDVRPPYSYSGPSNEPLWRQVEVDLGPLRHFNLTAWSPDGSRIAVLTDYHSVLYTVARDGTDSRVLVLQDDEGNLSAAGGRPLRDGQTAHAIYADEQVP